MNSLSILGFLLILLINISYGRRYNACTLAIELYTNGIPKNELSDWVCWAQHASELYINRVNLKNPDGSWDWGLFQINDEEWCSNTEREEVQSNTNRCGIDCLELLYNIPATIRCGYQVKESMGFQALIPWRNNCQYNKLDVIPCLLLEI